MLPFSQQPSERRNRRGCEVELNRAGRESLCVSVGQNRDVQARTALFPSLKNGWCSRPAGSWRLRAARATIAIHGGLQRHGAVRREAQHEPPCRSHAHQGRGGEAQPRGEALEGRVVHQKGKDTSIGRQPETLESGPKHEPPSNRALCPSSPTSCPARQRLFRHLLGSSAPLLCQLLARECPHCRCSIP